MRWEVTSCHTEPLRSSITLQQHNLDIEESFQLVTFPTNGNAYLHCFGLLHAAYVFLIPPPKYNPSSLSNHTCNLAYEARTHQHYVGPTYPPMLGWAIAFVHGEGAAHIAMIQDRRARGAYTTR